MPTSDRSADTAHGPIWDETVDVLVVGMGAAGCAAALTAHENGASVRILERTPPDRAGGNTRVSGGAWFHHTDADRIATYLRSLSDDRPVPEPVVRAWAEGVLEITPWIESLGATVGAYPPEYPELEGSDAYNGYRGVDGVLGDSRLFGAFEKAIQDRAIPVRYDSRATSLLMGADGEVRGAVTADGSRIGARRGVVLATGGFESDPVLVREFLGLQHVPVWGSTSASGDGLRMGLGAGADVWNMDNMMAIDGIAVPGSRHTHFAMFLHARGYVWVDAGGARFVDECAPTGHGQALIDGDYLLHPGRPMHVVFDERTRLAGPISPGRDVLPVGWNLLMEGYDWSADNSAEIDAGWIRRADTLPELADLLGLPPDVLATSIEEFNAACSAGRDDLHHRDPATLVPVDQPPYYGYRSGPVLAWTNGGPRRNEHARVLDPGGRPIPGLYAAGTASSTYSWCKDGGFHIADAIVFGRRAGAHAAACTRVSDSREGATT